MIMPSVTRVSIQKKKIKFKELLEKDNSVTVQVKNLQALVTEIMYKVQNNCSPEIMNNFFPHK